MSGISGDERLEFDWDDNYEAEVAFVKLYETREWLDLATEACHLTHERLDGVFEGMIGALAGYLRGLD